MNRSYPLRVKIDSIPKSAAVTKMIPDQGLASMAFSQNKTFRMPVQDSASVIGFRRVDTFNVDLPWTIVN